MNSIVLSTSEITARRFGVPLANVAKLGMKNAASLATMAEKAKKTGKKVNGYTEAQLRKFATATQLRAEWTELLAQNNSLRAMNPARDAAGTAHLDRYEQNVRTLLAALDTPKASGPTFLTKLASVGNQDMGQHHREGVASPTVLVEADSLATLVKVYAAYLSVYEMGSGNVARAMGDVYREGVLVARISYNGRVWTPEEFPNCKEIDPSTGNLKTASA